MKERPILFSGEMVRAILDGRKTQTRRVVKLDLGDTLEAHGPYDKDPHVEIKEWCPYGKIRDELWVRETFKVAEFEKYKSNSNESCNDNFDPSGAVIKYDVVRGPDQYFTDLDEKESEQAERFFKRGKNIPSIHMPRWASRIQLRIIDVRVERLQDISEEDAREEGVHQYGDSSYKIYTPTDRFRCRHARESFESLWESINAKRGYGWNENPWVWVIEFERIKP